MYGLWISESTYVSSIFDLHNIVEGNMSKRIVATLLCLCMTLAGVFVISTPASALGYHAWLCGQDNQWAGQSTSGGASTKQIGRCGTAYVRAYYQLYNGSPVYYTNWVSDNTEARANPGNTVLGGNHKVSSCGLIYSCGPYST
jgi:hypothetical protein